tara:strand:+ start:16211 stop:17248 length:1038 start_codon:yes stop_codon:yes gene_type:complete
MIIFRFQFLLFIVLIIGLSNVRATESVYLDGFNSSLDMYSSQNYEDAIDSFSKLIKSGNLGDDILSQAFLYRGVSNYYSGNYIASITDITNSLWLDLLNSEERQLAYKTRSAAREKIGQTELAQQDINSLNSFNNEDSIDNEVESKLVNIEDKQINKRIEQIRNNFSSDIRSFFGNVGEEELDQMPSSNYVLDDKDLYKKVLLFNQETQTQDNEIDDAIQIKEEGVKEEEFIPEVSDEIDEDLSFEDIVSNNTKRNNKNQITESSYLILAREVLDTEAKIIINKIINENFRALSGSLPKTRKNIVKGNNIYYDVILGPFTNNERLIKIMESLDSNNFKYETNILE